MSGPGALCVGAPGGPLPGALSVGARRSVSGPGALCVGARRSFRRGRRSLCRGPPLSVESRRRGPAVLSQDSIFQVCRVWRFLSVSRGPTICASGPGALCVGAPCCLSGTHVRAIEVLLIKCWQHVMCAAAINMRWRNVQFERSNACNYSPHACLPILFGVCAGIVLFLFFPLTVRFGLGFSPGKRERAGLDGWHADLGPRSRMGPRSWGLARRWRAAQAWACGAGWIKSAGAGHRVRHRTGPDTHKNHYSALPSMLQ